MHKNNYHYRKFSFFSYMDFHSQIEATPRDNFPLYIFFSKKTISYPVFPKIGILLAYDLSTDTLWHGFFEIIYRTNSGLDKK